jgi:hypothetical protein
LPASGYELLANWTGLGVWQGMIAPRTPESDFTALSGGTAHDIIRAMKRRSALEAIACIVPTGLGATGVPGATGSHGIVARPPDAGALREDIDLVRELLLTLHPGLYRYTTPLALEARWQALRESFVTAPDLRTRYLLLSEMLASLRCGHSYANFFNQRPEVAAELFDRATRLPFHFRWLGGEMVVTGGTASGLALGPGTVIESIDGLPASALWKRLAPYARVDGHNEGKARSLLSVAGRQRLEFFDVFHGLVTGSPTGGVFRLALRDPDGRRRTVEAPALTMAARHAVVAATPGRDAPVWTWQVHDNGAAVMRMPGWALYSSSWNWRGWLGERLDELSSTSSLRGLIVDLRGNEGGLDCGHPIIERFAGEPNALPGRRLVRYRRVPAALNRLLETWDNKFRDWGEQAQEVDDRFYVLPSVETTLQPRQPRIDKPLVVLVDGANSSATFGFAQRVRQGRLGTLVGETTGGNLRGINGGAFFFARLPASGLEFDLPLIGYFPPGLPPDGGLAPDVSVLPSPADLAAGRDVQLLSALDLVAHGRKS